MLIKSFISKIGLKDRLKETGFNFEIGGRNSYPDFRMVKSTDGYELKRKGAYFSSMESQKCYF